MGSTTEFFVNRLTQSCVIDLSLLDETWRFCAKLVASTCAEREFVSVFGDSGRGWVYTGRCVSRGIALARGTFVHRYLSAAIAGGT